MSLRKFHNSISSSSTREFSSEIGLWVNGGGFTILTIPNTLWHNGSTYSLGFEDNATNNQVWIIKQTGYAIETTKVGSGTITPEPLNHATPLLHIDKTTGYIYVLQNEEHVQPFRVWKSDSPEDISAFTYLGDFDTDASYLIAFDASDTTDMWFVTRSGDSSNNGYDMSTLNVNLDTLAYTKLRITEGDFTTNQVRHYMMASYFTGTSTYRTLFVNHRNESTGINYKVSIILKKNTDDIVHDFDLSTSKDVGVSGGLTTTELESDYILVGTDSDKTVWNTVLSSLQIDNDVFVVTSEPTGTYLKKYTIGSLTPVATYTLPWWATFYLYNAGDKLLVFGYDTGNKIQLFEIGYDLTGFSSLKTFSNLPLNQNFGMPFNYYDVDGKYLIIGSSVSGDSGNVPYLITNQIY